MSPRRAVPYQPPKRGSERFFYLSVHLKCDCGQERDLQMRRRPNPVSDRGNDVVSPCCLRRYRVIRWEDGGPVFECYGVESWKSGELEVIPTDDPRFTETLKRHKQTRRTLSKPFVGKVRVTSDGAKGRETRDPTLEPDRPMDHPTPYGSSSRAQ